MPSISFHSCSTLSTVRVSSVHAQFSSFCVKNPDLSIHTLQVLRNVSRSVFVLKNDDFSGHFAFSGQSLH